MTTRSHKGLVLRDVTVRRGGKTFTQKRWVKATDDDKAETKNKLKETSETYKIGDQINFLGDKFIKIEKVSESERTIKLSDGLVYTFEAFELGKRGISNSKYNVGDSVVFNGKNHTIKSVSMLGSVRLDDNTDHTFGDMETFGGNPEKKDPVTDLKSNNDLSLLINIVKSEKEATKFVVDHGWIWDNKSNIFPDVDDYADLRAPTHAYLGDDDEIYGLAKFAEDDDDEKCGYIHRLEINSALRGKGYGRKMMKSVISDLLKMGCESVHLDSLDENSNKFYRAIGMEEMSRNEFWGDLAWMKEITKSSKINKSESNDDDDIKYDPMAKKVKLNKKITIKKSELIKIINPDILIPKTYDQMDIENETVKNVNNWIADQEKNLIVELGKLYN